MSDNVENLGIRLSAEGVPELTNGMGLAATSTENAGKKADAAGKAFANNTEQMSRSGKTARETAAAWRLLPAQMTDIVTSLASGQPAWLVAIQQGGQIKDSFGGVGPMFRELASAVTVGRVAMAGAAAGAGALALAYLQAQRENRAFVQALVLTNNAAGSTAEKLATMAEQVSNVVGTEGKAAEALAALAGTGEVASANLARFAATAIKMERDLDVPLSETAARFEELGRAPLEASLKFNRGLNYLTGAIYDHIRALQAQGRWTEAAAVAQGAYSDAMNKATTQIEGNLTVIELGARKARDAAKSMWDKFVDPIRVKNVDKTLKSVKESFDLMALFSRAAQAGQGGQWAWAGGLPEPKDTSAEDAEEVARRKKELRDRERANIEAGIAVELAQAGAASAQRQALAAEDLARAQADGTRRQSQLEAQIATLEDLRIGDLASLGDYYALRAVLEQQGLGIEKANVDAEMAAARKQASARVAMLDQQLAAERRRQPETPAEKAQQEARLIDLAGQRAGALVNLETRLIELRARRGQLTAQQDAVAIAAERALMNASAEAADRYLEDVERRRQALAQLNDQQRQANAAAAVDLIADPYTRATARAKLDIEELNRFYTEQLSGLRARLPGLYTSDPDQAEAVRQQILVSEQQKNDAIVLRQRQLTEELKPEWQKQLSIWQDHTRLMRESFDSFQNGWLQSGQQAWDDYMRTGKLSVSGISEFARVELGRVIFKQTLAEPFSKLGQSIASAVGLGGTGLDAAAVASEATSRSLNTAAITANTSSLGSLAVAANYAAAALSQVAASGGSGTAGLLGQLLGSLAGGNGTFSAVDPGGYGMTNGSIPLPTAGGLASGGRARAGSLHEVNEDGPELLTVNNRTYLMMGGKDGYVTPNGGRGGGGDGQGGGVSITFAPQISIDARTDRAQVLDLVDQAMRTSEARLLDKMGRGMA